MKEGFIIGTMLGMVAGAVTVCMCKPARELVKKGTEAVKSEVENMKKKVSGDSKGSNKQNKQNEQASE